MEPTITGPAPVAVGGVGGSGTRLVARILSDAGMYLGDDLNRALDNLWFTLLFDRPRWLPARLAAGDGALARGFSIFRRAMTVGLDPSPADLAFIAKATYELSRYGHDVDGTGRGAWGLARGRSLLGARGHDADRHAGWGWKEPNSTMLVLEPMRRHLGSVRYVHVMRHGLDAAYGRLEVHRTWARLFGGSTEPGPVAALRFWLDANERALGSASGDHADDLLVVRLEELCADPAAGIRRLLAFAGVDAHDELVARLAELPSLPPSAGRYRQRDLSVFAADDLGRLRALGYEVEARGAQASRRRPVISPSGTTISVALCTYEGERFLPEQLGSLLAQTRPPDEVVAVDDRSTDRTVELLAGFAQAAPFPVRVVRNDENLGSTKNFEKAVGLCRGDLVFLCDQDDVWHHGKLARIEQVFAARPDVGAVFTDADLIDDDSRSSGHGLWDTIGFTEPLRRRMADGDAMPVLVQGNTVTGAALAFRASYRDLLVPFPAEWVQDAWVAILLAAVARILPLDEPLIRYRIHPAQQIGVRMPPKKTKVDLAIRRMQFRRRITKQERAAMLEFSTYFGAAVQRLRDREDRYPVRPGAIEDLEGKVRHLRLRGEMWTMPHRWRVVAGELAAGSYGRFSNGLVSAAKDLVLLDRLAARRGGEPA